MIVQLSRTVLNGIVTQAQAAGVEECCGLLLADEAGRIDAILPAANVAADRRRRFEIDPTTLIAAHRAERGGRPRIAGCYHSHPGGEARPSAEDAAQAAANGWLWLICAGETVTGWRAGAGGFTAVALTITD